MHNAVDEGSGFVDFMCPFYIDFFLLTKLLLMLLDNKTLPKILSK